MKTKLFSILILMMLVIPASGYAAELDKDSIESQLNELNALVGYVVRTFHLENLTPLTASKTRSVIAHGAKWLKNSQEEDGHFAYEYAPYEGEYLDDDNIVRQAGALYELGEIVRRDTERALDLADTIESSIAYFEDLSREDEFLKVSFRCIVEHAESERCKLGATSLALVGILSYVEAYPEKADEYEDLIEDYVLYIVNAKHLDAGFRNIHIVGINAQPNKESSFSNGEAMLALVRYMQYNNNPTVDNVIDETFLYLKEQEFDTALYLWIMAALKDLQALEPNDEYVDYAKDFTKWRVDRIAPFKKTKKNYCAYAEGIASAYSVLEASASDDERIALRQEIDFWNVRNSRLQVLEDDTHRFEMVDGELQLHTIPNILQAKGGFLTSDEVLTQRIDFTQHCISAYLQTLVDIDGETL